MKIESTVREVASSSSAFEGSALTERCERCGALYAATWIPSWSRTGQAVKAKTRYCSMACKNAAKTDRDRARYEARKAAGAVTRIDVEA